MLGEILSHQVFTLFFASISCYLHLTHNAFLVTGCPLNKDNNPTTDIVEPTVAQSLKGGEKNFMDDLKSAEVVSCLVAVLIAGAFIGIVIAHVCHRRQSPKKTSLHGMFT